MPPIGLIAGNGRFPLFFAESASRSGNEVVAVAIREETNPELEKLVKEIHWFHVGELQGMIDMFLKRGIDRLVMAGKITKTRMFNHLKPDARLLRVFEKTPLRNDDALLKALAGEFIAEGIHVCDSTTFLSALLPQAGTLTKRAPTEQEWLDIRYGYGIAKQIAGLDIGQTVVVKNCAILAVEAIEGTDEAILRGGKLGNGEVTVVKVARPQQDMRFDLPVVGLETIRSLTQVKARCLAIEEKKTLLLDRDELIAQADAADLAITVI
ncbi:MAG: UDP-2,3-diacylglucosamine diphosphatase LpxI [Candidatus Ozemobacteraceae bacterium]